MRRRRMLLGALIIALTACSDPSSAPGLRPALPDASARDGAVRPALRASLRIVIPKRKHRARFVSASTESGTVTVAPAVGCLRCTTGFTEGFALTQGSPGCGFDPSGSGLVCTISLTLAPGTYTGSMALYDGPLEAGKPSGNVLSANQSFPLAVAAGRSNAVSVTLDGVPFYFGELALDSNAGVLADYDVLLPYSAILFSRAGVATRIEFYAVDRDGDVILGPGAPTFAFTPTGGFTAARLSGDVYVFTPPAKPVAGEFSMGMSVSSPECGEPDAGCATIDDTKFDLGFATIAAVASGDSVVVNFGQTVVATVTQGISSPQALAFDDSGDLFVANQTNVTEYAWPYTGAPVATISNGIARPETLAIDASGHLFVGDMQSQSVVVYSPPSYGAPVNTIPLGGVRAVSTTLDASGRLWAATGNEIVRFPEPLTGTTPDQTLSVFAPACVATDERGDVFAASQTSIVEYDVSAGSFVKGIGVSGLTGLAALASFNSASPTAQNKLAASSSSGSLMLFGTGNGLSAGTAALNVQDGTQMAWDQYGTLFVVQPGYDAVSLNNPYDLSGGGGYFNVANPSAIAVFPAPLAP